MKPEELLAQLKENGLQEDEIEALLAETIKLVQVAESEEQEVAPAEEQPIDEEEKMKQVFGI